MTHKKLKALTLGAALLAAMPAAAQLAGKNVILVHGFQYSDLSNPPGSLQQVEQNGYAYWQAFWDAHADARVDWGSDQRVEGGHCPAGVHPVQTDLPAGAVQQRLCLRDSLDR